MGILDFVFPKNCLGCNRSGVYICPACMSKVRVLRPVCPYCERPSIDGFTHPKCAKKYGLDGLISLWKYEGVVKKAIWAIKFKYATEVGEELSGICAENLRNILPSGYGFEAVVPIPIHWHRQNVRGFNQSQLIGKVVARQLGWKFEPDLLIKKLPTASQVDIPVSERKRNLRGVFEIKGTHVPASAVLFDDVFTTGSTLKEAAKTLKRAGVKKVWGLTLAR